jgi:hypothetical protein
MHWQQATIAKVFEQGKQEKGGVGMGILNFGDCCLNLFWGFAALLICML